MTSEFDTESTLENEEDFLDARIEVLSKLKTYKLEQIALRKGIDISAANGKKNMVTIIAHAEAERIGLLPARPPLAEEPGPLISTQYIDGELKEQAVSHEMTRTDGTYNIRNNTVTNNGVGMYPAEDVSGIPFASPLLEQLHELAKRVAEDSQVEQEATEPCDAPGGHNLPQAIMDKWIGAIGGMEWYKGSFAPNAELAREHGKALAAALDAVFEELPLSMQRTPYDIQTSSGWFIYEDILPDLLRHFFMKNASYGDQHRYGLGPAAEWVGIDRKIHKLERVLWNGDSVSGPEDAREMLYDLVGQCFIILDLLAGNHNPRGRNSE